MVKPPTPIDRDVLWDMQMLAAVVDGGSIAAGARAMRVTPSATSKRLAAMEQRLGVQLLHRTTRHLRITVEGASYLERARNLLSLVHDLERTTREERTALRGEVRLTAPALLGQEVVTGVLARLLLEHPELTVHLDLSDRCVDLASEPFDLAVRVAAKLSSPELVARRIATVQTTLVASPGYLSRRGTPPNVASLSEHAMLELAHDADRGNWHLQTAHGLRIVPVRPVFVCTRLAAIRQAAIAGVGIARLPTYLIQDDLAAGRLEQLLPKCVIDRRGVFLVRAPQSFVPPRVREVTEVLAREIPRALAVD